MIVVDSNVLAARNLAGAQASLAERVERIDSVWVVPPLWRYEFQNILTTAIRVRQLTPEAAVGVWTNTAAQLAQNEQEPSPEHVIELSARYRISAYDANFIALAMELSVRCVTEDGELQKKFPGLAMSMDTFIRQGMVDGEAREARAPYRVHKRKREVLRACPAPLARRKIATKKVIVPLIALTQE